MTPELPFISSDVQKYIENSKSRDFDPFTAFDELSQDSKAATAYWHVLPRLWGPGYSVSRARRVTLPFLQTEDPLRTYFQCVETLVLAIEHVEPHEARSIDYPFLHSRHAQFKHEDPASVNVIGPKGFGTITLAELLKNELDYFSDILPEELMKSLLRENILEGFEKRPWIPEVFVNAEAKRFPQRPSSSKSCLGSPILTSAQNRQEINPQQSLAITLRYLSLDNSCRYILLDELDEVTTEPSGSCRSFQFYYTTWDTRDGKIVDESHTDVSFFSWDTDTSGLAEEWNWIVRFAEEFGLRYRTMVWRKCIDNNFYKTYIIHVVEINHTREESVFCLLDIVGKHGLNYIQNKIDRYPIEQFWEDCRTWRWDDVTGLSEKAEIVARFYQFLPSYYAAEAKSLLIEKGWFSLRFWGLFRPVEDTFSARKEIFYAIAYDLVTHSKSIETRHLVCREMGDGEFVFDFENYEF